MNFFRNLAAVAVTFVAAFGAEQRMSTEEKNPEVVLPVMKVPATRLERFGISRHQWQSMLTGYFKIVVKRPTGRRSFQLLELDGRSD